MSDIEKRFEPKFGVEEEKAEEKEKSLTFTVATKEGNFAFEEMPFEKLNINEEVSKNAFKEIKEITEEENKFFEKFSGDRKIIEEVIMDTEGDNYFSLERKEEEPRAIKFPGRNNEILKTTETTKPIVRHEAFHQAMKLENSKGIPFWLEIEKNIEKGKDTKLPFFEKEVKTSKFKEFTREEDASPSFLDAVVYGAHPEVDIRELIEEKLADEHMISQEISKNGLKRGTEIITKAKLTSLDIITKNKNLKDYKKLPSSTESYYGLINGRNTLITLMELNREAKNLPRVKEFKPVVREYENKIREYVKDWGTTYAEAIGYEKKEDLEKINEKFLKSFDEIIKEK